MRVGYSGRGAKSDFQSKTQKIIDLAIISRRKYEQKSQADKIEYQDAIKGSILSLVKYVSVEETQERNKGWGYLIGIAIGVVAVYLLFQHGCSKDSDKQTGFYDGKAKTALYAQANRQASR